jgi:hypothetical protein
MPRYAVDQHVAESVCVCVCVYVYVCAACAYVCPVLSSRACVLGCVVAVCLCGCAYRHLFNLYIVLHTAHHLITQQRVTIMPKDLQLARRIRGERA